MKIAFYVYKGNLIKGVGVAIPLDAKGSTLGLLQQLTTQNSLIKALNRHQKLFLFSIKHAKK